jgi:hypothetical protein
MSDERGNSRKSDIGHWTRDRSDSRCIVIVLHCCGRYGAPRRGVAWRGHENKASSLSPLEPPSRIPFLGKNARSLERSGEDVQSTLFSEGDRRTSS